MQKLLLTCLPLFLIAIQGAPAFAQDEAIEEEDLGFSNEQCLECHLKPDLTRMEKGVETLMPVFPIDAFNASEHSLLNCVFCHVGVTELEHQSSLPPADCAECHEMSAEEYDNSIHGASLSLGSSSAASCADCHGAHDIIAVNNPASPVFKFNLPKTCAQCHTNDHITDEYQMKYPDVANQYMDSIHGRALLQMGLIVAPSCNDCHGVHDIKRSVDAGSPIHHENISSTCGKCHVTVEETYLKSVHGKLLAQGDPDGPVCTDCHSAHEIEPPTNGRFKMASDRQCGKCHEDQLTHYRDTYHGKAMELGRRNVSTDVAACYDCHGHHDILPPSDPGSRLHASNIVETCRQCHPNANEGFAQYIPHANPLDRANYPELYWVFFFMTALLVGVFAFFGGHTILWLLRSIWLYMHDSKTFRETKVQSQADEDKYTRFQPFERFLHFLLVTSFLLLVLTGMPLKFYYTDWAKAIFDVIGGVVVARKLHHFGAVVTFLYFGLHLSSLAIMVWKNRAKLRHPETGRLEIKRAWSLILGPDSMVPTIQDWRDFVAHNKWFFGSGKKPQFDRWTYWEKFDYFAVFWGVFIIGFSGLVMWFPEYFTQWMPGWIINVMLIIHSDEALLASGFIFTIHFFNTHFRLEKFPMDTVIFSGRISKSEMMHERKRWYDRLTAEGRLDDYKVRDEWQRWKNIARSFGYLFFGTGIILLILIIYAMATRLIH